MQAQNLLSYGEIQEAIDLVSEFLEKKKPLTPEVEKACEICRYVLLQRFDAGQSSNFSDYLWKQLNKVPLKKLRTKEINTSFRNVFRLTHLAAKAHILEIDKAVSKVDENLKEKIPADIAQLTAIAVVHFPYISNALDHEVKERILLISEKSPLLRSQDKIKSRLIQIFRNFHAVFSHKKWKGFRAEEKKGLQELDEYYRQSFFIAEPTTNKVMAPEDESKVIALEEEPLIHTVALEDDWVKIKKEGQPAQIEPAPEPIAPADTAPLENSPMEARLQFIGGLIKRISNDYVEIFGKSLIRVMDEELSDAEFRKELRLAIPPLASPHLEKKWGFLGKILGDSMPAILSKDGHLIVDFLEHSLLNLTSHKDLLSKWSKETLPAYFLTDPKIISPQKKNGIIGALAGIENFLADLRHALDLHCSGDIKQMTSSLEEEKVLQEMNQSLLAKKLKPFCMEDFYKEAKEILQLCLPELPDLAHCLIGAVGVNLLNRALAPEVIFPLWNRLLQEGIDLTEPTEEKVFVENEIDTQFSQNLGRSINQILAQVIPLAQIGFLINIIRAALMWFLQEGIGKKIQAGIAEMLASPCIFKPVLAADKLLYVQQKTPALLSFFDEDYDWKKDYEAVKKSIDEDQILYTKINEMLQNNSLLKDSSLIRRLCLSLSELALTLAEKPEMLKMLAWHIGESVKANLTRNS